MIGSWELYTFYDWIQLGVSYLMIKISILMKISISPFYGNMGDIDGILVKIKKKIMEIDKIMWKSG